MVSPDFVRSTIQLNPTQKDLRMTSSAVRPETVAREFSFALRGTLSSLPYGQFFRDGRLASNGTYFATSSALSSLNRFVETNQVPEKERVAIEEEIRTSGLPEKEPYHGPYRFVTKKLGQMIGAHFFANTDNVVLGNGELLISKESARALLESAIERGAVLPEEQAGLLEAVNSSELPEDNMAAVKNSLTFIFKMTDEPNPVGPFTFRVTQGKKGAEGCVLDKNGERVSPLYLSKAEATYEIRRHTEDGHFQVEDRDSLLKQIEDSQLPNNWMQVITFEMCGCPARSLHGYVYVDGERIGGPAFSISDVDLLLAKMLEIGVVNEETLKAIRDKASASGLPESIGD